MHIIKICTSCSCEKRFALESLKRAEQVLGIKVGETTENGRFKLEKTGCLSHCEKGPNVAFCEVNGPLDTVITDGINIENGMLPNKIEQKINSLKSA